MPMGFTNSPTEFQNCMAFILQDEIPHVANIFIDDVGVCGPLHTPIPEGEKPETIPENPGIRKYVWQHALDVHRIMHRVKCAGATFNPAKAQICKQDVVILEQTCTPQGRIPEDKKTEKIKNWPELKTTKDIRGFLGLCGTVHIWIPNYSQIAHPLTELVCKDAEIVWDERR